MKDSTQNAIRRTRFLKLAEERYRKFRGVHPAHPWSEWGDRPRGGARWSSKEEEVLIQALHSKTQESGVLGAQALCELAWEHGRSADSVRTKLLKLIGWNVYYRTFGWEI